MEGSGQLNGGFAMSGEMSGKMSDEMSGEVSREKSSCGAHRVQFLSKNGKEGRGVMFFRTDRYPSDSQALQAAETAEAGIWREDGAHPRTAHDERASRRVSPEGSLTVEAALVFPLFLLTLMALLYLFFLLQLHAEIGRALTDAGRELAKDAYLSEYTGDTAASAAAVLYGKRTVESYLKGRTASAILTGGTGGITFLGSSWNAGTAEITLQASYQVQLPPGLSWFHGIRLTQTRTARGWVGFNGRQDGQAVAGEGLVYVTDYGEVYHNDLGCRYLNLQIRQTDTAGITALRNESGGKYYPCERCWTEGSVCAYYTSDGTRYHRSLNCSSLVRGIHTVLRSETQLPGCSLCGG